MALQHLRSNTANKRPDPTAMAEGQLALNTANASPGLFYKDGAGNLIKAGPAHIGSSAPNTTPAAGGHAGNSVGEAWLDTSGTNALLKIYNGAAFVTVQPVVNGTVVSTADTGTVTSTMILDGTILNADINASAAIADTKLATIATGGKVSNSATTATNANTASAIVARDASGNFTAGTITAALTGNAATATALSSNRTFAVTGDITGTVSSDLTSGASIATSIAAGSIVDADVNAAAAIAGTKISPNFGGQTIVTTGAYSAPLGSASTPSLTFTGDLNTGIFSPGADQVAISTNGTGRLSISSAGEVTTTNEKLNLITVGRGAGAISSNTAVGLSALVSNTTGNNNTANGVNALRDNTTGTDNTCYGYEAGKNLTTGSNNTIIGNIVGTAGLANTVIIGAGSAERLRIDSSGRLLVGTSTAYGVPTGGGGIDSPGLQRVAAANAGSTISAVLFNTAASGGGTLSLGRSNTTSIGTEVIAVNNDVAGSVFFSASDGVKQTTLARIFAAVDGTPGANDMPGRLVFSTTADGASSPTERMRIQSDGNISIGSGASTTYRCAVAVASGADRDIFLGAIAGASNGFQVNWLHATTKLSVKFNNIATTASAANAFLDSTDSNRIYRSTSSLRYKKDVEDIDQLKADAVLSLRPVWYRSNVSSDRQDWSWYGLIAEEVAQVEPRLVHWTYLDEDYETEIVNGEIKKTLKEGAQQVPDGVQYDRLTVLLLDVVKRQQQAIETLESKVAALESK